MRAAKEEYEYDFDQCSVTDKPLLKEFRKKRTEWMDWLERDPDHNVWDQIHSTMWSDAAYRSLNEARRFASRDTPTAAVNGMLGEFIDLGYVAVQVLNICKLIDKSNNDPKKGVISLRRLADDIKLHRHLITRENFVSFDGLPYDYAMVQNAQLASGDFRKIRWIDTKGPEAWSTSQRMHEAFDKLSGVTPEKRAPLDLIHESVFKTISAWFDAPIFEKFSIYRNKYISHAADKVSRQIKPLDRLGLTLDEIAEAQIVIIRIATAIGANILEAALGGVVPTPQFDVFEHLELPVIPAAKMPEMGEWWHQHSNERENWLREKVDLISGQITPTQP